MKDSILLDRQINLAFDDFILGNISDAKKRIKTMYARYSAIKVVSRVYELAEEQIGEDRLFYRVRLLLDLEQ